MADRVKVEAMDKSKKNSPMAGPVDQEATVMMDTAADVCHWNGVKFEEGQVVVAEGVAYECSFGRWVPTGGSAAASSGPAASPLGTRPPAGARGRTHRGAIPRISRSPQPSRPRPRVVCGHCRLVRPGLYSPHAPQALSPDRAGARVARARAVVLLGAGLPQPGHRQSPTGQDVRGGIHRRGCSSSRRAEGAG